MKKKSLLEKSHNYFKKKRKHDFNICLVRKNEIKEIFEIIIINFENEYKKKSSSIIYLYSRLISVFSKIIHSLSILLESMNINLNFEFYSL